MEINSIATLTIEEIEIAIGDWLRQNGLAILKRVEFDMSSDMDGGNVELHGASCAVKYLKGKE